MGRKRKEPFQRHMPPCAVDAAFMLRLAKALNVASLSDNACILIAYSIHLHNAARPDRANRVGRPLNLSVHILVDGLLDILEDDGLEVTTNKREGRRGEHNNGRIADFLRVIWGALEHPDRDADGFARLAANCAAVLGRTKGDRQERRAQRRAPRTMCIEWQRNAWRR
jgi:hypothetical protein